MSAVGGRVDPPGSVGGVVDGRYGVPITASQSIGQSTELKSGEL